MTTTRRSERKLLDFVRQPFNTRDWLTITCSTDLIENTHCIENLYIGKFVRIS